MYMIGKSPSWNSSFNVDIGRVILNDAEKSTFYSVAG